MPGFSKLESSIIHSTIWREPNHIRIVWITMLAMTDPKGRVMSSVPGLADAARVSLEECIEALDRFRSPDEWSRDPENDGRRIDDIAGGWLILNYMKYRDPKSTERVRKHRGKQQKKSETVSSVSCVPKQSEPVRTDPEADPEAEAEEEKSKNTRKRVQYPADFERFWRVYPVKKEKAKALKAFKESRRRGVLPSVDELVQTLEVQKQWKQWREGYVVYPERWIKNERWDDEDPDQQTVSLFPSQPKHELTPEEREELRRMDHARHD